MPQAYTLSDGRSTDDILRLAPFLAGHVRDRSPEGRRQLVLALERHLTAERSRGLARHWSYDLARHTALYRLLARERRELASLV